MSKFFIFEIQNFQTTSDGETTNTKIIVLDNIYKFELKTFSFEFSWGLKYSSQNRVYTRLMFVPFKAQMTLVWSG
jgi:hypothetical protein